MGFQVSRFTAGYVDYGEPLHVQTLFLFVRPKMQLSQIDNREAS